MARRGDKYIIEIDDVFYDSEEKAYYKIKGFNTLIFDDFGIERLTKVLEPSKDDKEVAVAAKAFVEAWKRNVEREQYE